LKKKEGVSGAHMFHRLVFGRFLNLLSVENKLEIIPKNFTGRRFRELWATVGTGHADRHKYNERVRFLEIIRLIRGAPEGASARAFKHQLDFQRVRAFVSERR
jgi:hypothetical protein